LTVMWSLISGNRQSTALVSEVDRWYFYLPQLYLLIHSGR
jgi:hypothetical protein